MGMGIRRGGMTLGGVVESIAGVRWLSVILTGNVVVVDRIFSCVVTELLAFEHCALETAFAHLSKCMVIIGDFDEFLTNRVRSLQLESLTSSACAPRSHNGEFKSSFTFISLDCATECIGLSLHL